MGKLHVTRRMWMSLALGLGLLAGCRPVQVAQPLTASLAGSDPVAQMEFWHTLAQRGLTSNDEAFHGLLLFVDGQDPAADYAGRVKLLDSRLMLPKGFAGAASDAVTRGTLAVALARALEIKGGLTMRALAPRSPRYATRELAYLELYPESSPNQTLSGTEFVGLIGRAEDYQRVQAQQRASGADSLVAAAQEKASATTQPSR